ncbi:MAG: hypothetical protein ACE5EE_06370 [Fidelibacterota bacterium]
MAVDKVTEERLRREIDWIDLNSKKIDLTKTSLAILQCTLQNPEKLIDAFMVLEFNY